MTTRLIKGKDYSSSILLLLYPIGPKGVSDRFSRAEATEHVAVSSTYTAPACTHLQSTHTHRALDGHGSLRGFWS